MDNHVLDRGQHAQRAVQAQQRFARTLQLVFAGFDLFRHLVEAGGEPADFVLGMRQVGARRELRPTQALGGLAQVAHRPQHDAAALPPDRGKQGQHRGENQYRAAEEVAQRGLGRRAFRGGDPQIALAAHVLIQRPGDENALDAVDADRLEAGLRRDAGDALEHRVIGHRAAAPAFGRQHRAAAVHHHDVGACRHRHLFQRLPHPGQIEAQHHHRARTAALVLQRQRHDDDALAGYPADQIVADHHALARRLAEPVAVGHRRRQRRQRRAQADAVRREEGDAAQVVAFGGGLPQHAVAERGIERLGQAAHRRQVVQFLPAQREGQRLLARQQLGQVCGAGAFLGDLFLAVDPAHVGHQQQHRHQGGGREQQHAHGEAAELCQRHDVAGIPTGAP